MTHFEKAVLQMKNKLIKKAKKNGIYENFGQTEYKKLKDSWENTANYNEIIMIEFYNWIISFNLSDL